MTGIFKANNPYNTFLLFIYGLLLKLPIFLHPEIPSIDPIDGFLFKEMLRKMQLVNMPAIVYPLITFLLLFTQAITFNKLVSDQKLLQKPNYLTGMSYLLITSLFKEWSILSASLIINTLLVWVWARMSSLYNNPHAQTTLFNIGMVIGVSTFFYFPSVAFAALIIFALIVTRPFRLSEWLIALLGIITPYYFLLAYVFLTDKWQGYKFQGIAVSYPKFHQSGWALAAIIIVLFASIVGVFFIQQNQRRQLVQTRKSWNLVFLYFLVAVFIPFINATYSFQHWILSAIPLSVFMASAFLYPTKKWFALTLHWIIVLFVIAFSYFVS
ncbi:DUF6427 family protein [Ferruginibacter albus]|uniref:DUF6427 family protein n=1 Tax=Ferruginibacter albus TaxID=2875540 RepID=UPI001CC74B53|nr:DUF6427 family protein [Ferruginibacter albus]UAY52465.1 DUF6427 family protein [Ferruginibacter albus]